MTGQPAEAERWADVVDRWQYRDAARPATRPTEAWAAVLRTMLCRRGAEQMRADADEAVRRCAEEGFVMPTAAFLQGIARILCGDLGRRRRVLGDAVSGLEEVGAPETLAFALCERSLVAMARGEWSRAEALAARQAACCAGPGSRTACDAPALRGASPGGPAPGRRPGGAPGTRHGPAAAAPADLRGAPSGRSGPDRARPRAPRAGRPGRGQDADAGDRRAAPAAARPGHPGRRGRGAAGPAVPAARCRQSRGVGADRGRAAAASLPADPPDRGRDRRASCSSPATRSRPRSSRSTASWASAPATTRCRRPRPSACSAL